MWATSASGGASSLARNAARSAPAAASAGAVRADTSTSSTGRAGGVVGRGGGASSTIAWALVPPKPNDDTPARRGPALAGHGVSACWTRNGLAAKSIVGLGATKLIDGGSVRVCSASAVLIRLDAPAAITMWPTLLLSEPIAQKPRSAVWRRKARVRPSISIGSPSGVAVPWAST